MELCRLFTFLVGGPIAGVTVGVILTTQGRLVGTKRHPGLGARLIGVVLILLSILVWMMVGAALDK